MGTTVRKQKSGDQLAPGDWLAPDALLEGAAEVLFVHAYPAGADRSRDSDGKHVHLMVREQGNVASCADVVSGNALFDLASEADLAELREQAERAQKIADIRAYVDWLERHPTEPVGYGLGGQVDIDIDDDAEAAARVRAFAAQYGAEVRDTLDDRTTGRLRFGSVEHAVIAWHKAGRPVEPAPEHDGPGVECQRCESEGFEGVHHDADPTGQLYSRDNPHPSWPTEAELKPWETLASPAEALAESMVPAELGEHYEASAWTGDGPGSCGVECACGVTFSGFDTGAEAREQLAHHIADPGGYNYGRADTADQDDPTPVSGGRTGPHVGAVTERGLVDETEGIVIPHAHEQCASAEDHAFYVMKRDRRTCVDPGDQEHDHAMCEDVVAEEQGLVDESAPQVGTNSGHGHVWPRPDGAVARCGGPGLCSQCSRDAALVR